MSSENETSYRFAHSVSPFLLAWMILLAVITALSGISYAGLKNEQYAIRSEINKINRNIAQSTLKINEHRAKINSMTSRWNMIGRLDSLGSELCDIRPDQMQELRTMRDADAGKATAAR